jgi:hypothetical protein
VCRQAQRRQIGLRSHQQRQRAFQHRIGLIIRNRRHQAGIGRQPFKGDGIKIGVWLGGCSLRLLYRHNPAPSRLQLAPDLVPGEG